MKTVNIFCKKLLYIVLFFANTVLAASDTTELDKFYNNVNTFEAIFKRKISDRDGNILRESYGNFLLKRPGNFKWEYKSPVHVIMVSDGKNIWSYDVSLQQAIVRPVSTLLDSVPIMLLTKQQSIEKYFYINKEDRQDSLNWIALKPKLDNSEFRKLYVGFFNGLLKKLEFQDNFDQITSINFQLDKVNNSIDDNTFKLTLPSNVDILGKAE